MCVKLTLIQSKRKQSPIVLICLIQAPAQQQEKQCIFTNREKRNVKTQI